MDRCCFLVRSGLVQIVIYVDWALNSCLSVKLIKDSCLQYDFTLFDYSQLKCAVENKKSIIPLFNIFKIYIFLIRVIFSAI